MEAYMSARPPRVLHPTHLPPISEEEDREGWGPAAERGRVTGGVEEVRVEESMERKGRKMFWLKGNGAGGGDGGFGERRLELKRDISAEMLEDVMGPFPSCTPRLQEAPLYMSEHILKLNGD